MGKDPAFLFYSRDFLAEAADLTMRERGQLITLLCLQHQRGHLSEEVMRRSIGGRLSSLVLEKLKTDEDGLYYHLALDSEVERRKQYSEQQRSRANMRWHKSGNAKALPCINATETETGTGKKSNVSGNSACGPAKKSGGGGPSIQEMENMKKLLKDLEREE